MFWIFNRQAKIAGALIRCASNHAIEPWQPFPDLFTMNELESLSDEIGLKKMMGGCFRHARAGKKDTFIAALLSVKGFAYRGAVPSVMRYPRTPFRIANAAAQTNGMTSESGAGNPKTTHVRQEALATA
jgi:hypothetical protein